MAETRSSVVHMRTRWQQQLRALLGVRQEYPLLGKKQQSALESSGRRRGKASTERLYQEVLCQGNFLWYLEVQSSSNITSL